MSKQELSPDQPTVTRVDLAEQKFSEIRLTTNPKLDYLAQFLASSEFDWNKIISTFHQSNIYRRGNYYGDNLPGVLLETHLGLILKNLTLFTEGISLDPIKNGDKTPNYIFQIRTNDRNRLIAVSKMNKKATAEYDRIITIDDNNSSLPVVIETKMTKHHNLGARSKSDLSSSLRPNHINRLFQPLIERFQQVEFGYIVATPQENISPTSFIQQAFTDSGGVLLGLPISYDEFILQSLRARFTRSLQR